MTFISKTAGTLSLVSCIHDMHKTALIYSNDEGAKTASNAKIESSIGNQKINHLSYKDAQRKNWIARQDFFISTKEFGARIGGYIKGFVQSGVRYIPNFILSAAAIIPNKKHKVIPNIATVGLAIVEAFDFIKNSTNISQRTDYLE